MKNTILTRSALGIAVVALVSWVLYPDLEKPAIDKGPKFQASYLSENSPAFAAIVSRLDDLAKSVALVSGATNETEVSVDGQIILKLEQMEGRLAELEKIVHNAISDDRVSEDERLAREVLQQARPIDAYRLTSAGEFAFEVDDGKPLGVHTDVIYDSFHELGDVVQLRDFQCKQSICKIAYSGNDAEYDRLSEYEDPGTLVIDKLSDNLDESSLDIRFSRESGGTQVMYVQLK